MTISQMPAAIVKVVGEGPTPGHGEIAANPKPDPSMSKISENAIAVAAPAQIADQATSGLPASAWVSAP